MLATIVMYETRKSGSFSHQSFFRNLPFFSNGIPRFIEFSKNEGECVDCNATQENIVPFDPTNDCFDCQAPARRLIPADDECLDCNVSAEPSVSTNDCFDCQAPARRLIPADDECSDCNVSAEPSVSTNDCFDCQAPAERLVPSEVNDLQACLDELMRQMEQLKVSELCCNTSKTLYEFYANLMKNEPEECKAFNTKMRCYSPDTRDEVDCAKIPSEIEKLAKEIQEVANKIKNMSFTEEPRTVIDPIVSQAYPPIPKLEKLLNQTVPPQAPGVEYDTPEHFDESTGFDFAVEILTNAEQFKLKMISVDESHSLTACGYKTSIVDISVFKRLEQTLLNTERFTSQTYLAWDKYMNYLYDYYNGFIDKLYEESLQIDFKEGISNTFLDIIPAKNCTFLPESLLGLSILGVLVTATWLYRSNAGFILQKTLCEVFGVIMLLVCYLYYNDLVISLNSSFYKSFLSDEFVKLIKFIICLIAGVYFAILASSFKEQNLTSPEYPLLLGFSILGLLLVCSGNDLLTIYLSLELISLSSYVLSAFKKSQHSCESGLKYFITGSLSSAFFIFGSSLLYLETNSINLSDYTNFFSYTQQSFSSDTVNTYLMDVGLSLIFFSLFIKLICAPFHLWSLDVYEESPTSSSFYFATITKLSLFIVLIKVSFYVFFNICFVWATFFTLVGMLSAFIGALGGLRQKKLKTLLAYSSVTNMGYALIVLGGFSDASVWAMLVHVIIYQFTGLCIWSLLIIIQLKNKRSKYSKELSDMSLLKKANISVSLAFALTLFSVAGIPPLLGFVPKIYIISEILVNNVETAAVFLALCSVIATFYYIRIIKIIFFENILVGKLYLPSFGFYSTIMSFLIHSLLYAFSDIWFLTSALVGISSLPLISWVINSSKVLWFWRLNQIEVNLEVTALKAFLGNLGLSSLKDFNLVQRDQNGLKFLASVNSWDRSERMVDTYIDHIAQEKHQGRERSYAIKLYYETFRRRILFLYRVDTKVKALLENF